MGHDQDKTQATRGVSLLTRVFSVNAAVLAIAAVLLILTPATVSSPPALGEVLVLVGGVTTMLVVNLFLLRQAFAPLHRVRAMMRTFDPLQPGGRLPPEGLPEIREVATTFNDMAERLERERRHSSVRALSAQERERQRLATELHDEVGQSLTGLLLLLKSAAKTTPPSPSGPLEDAKHVARSSLGDLRRIVQRLRPEALDELGLPSALNALRERMAEQAGIRIASSLDPDLPTLDAETELVLYRIAQEGLTNVVRHAGATRAELTLQVLPGKVRLQVADDGCGVNGGLPLETSGIQGMRERALLINGEVTFGRATAGGVLVTLDVPVDEGR